MNKSIFCLLIFFISCFPSQGQVKPSQVSFLTCAWENVAMRKEAKKTAAFVESIEFGQSVQVLDEKKYVPAERRTYVKVEANSGKLGWVDELLFIPDAIPVVLLQQALIYQRPNTPSSATLTSFETGDIVLLGRRNGNWAYVVNPNKRKIGWIKDNVPYSRRKLDIDLMKKWAKLQSSPSTKNLSASLTIYDEAQLQNSQLASYFLSQDEDLLIAVQSKARQVKPKPIVRSIEKPEVKKESSQAEDRLVWDEFDQSLYTETVETGAAIAVERAIEFPSPFFAFHKTLPTGSRIKMDLPDNSGFIELVVMDQLPSTEKAIIALSPACLISVFGTTNPDNVVISYRKD